MADDTNNQTESSPAIPKRGRGRPRKIALQTTEEGENYLAKSGRATRPRSPKIVVEVDLNRIEKAIRRDSQNCMIAEAIKETTPEMTSVSVDLQSIRFSDPAKNLRFIYLTPRICQMAIIDFDRGLKPEPFSFTLKKPYQITRFAHRAGTIGRTSTERLAAQRDHNGIKKQIYATQDDAPFKPPADYAKKVVRAMTDPQANLGPTIALDPPGAGPESTPILVGGTPPRHPGTGNIQRTRRFGLKALIR